MVKKIIICDEKIGKKKETKVSLMKSSKYVDYSVPKVDTCNLENEYPYRNEREKLSLPYPCCSFESF